MNVSEKIFEIVSRYTDTVFYLPGGQAAYLVEALGNSKLWKYEMLHEQSAGFSAIGYAQATGKLGVCLVTSGPGVTNLMTPLAACWTDSVPVLFISGQARANTLIKNARARTSGIQEVNTKEIVKPICKGIIELLNQENLEKILTNLIYTAQKGRHGGIWLSVPLDVQGEEYV